MTPAHLLNSHNLGLNYRQDPLVAGRRAWKTARLLKKRGHARRRSIVLHLLLNQLLSAKLPHHRASGKQRKKLLRRSGAR